MRKIHKIDHTTVLVEEKLLVVDDIGDVWPCEILKDKFGNLRDHDFDINKLLEKYESKKLVKFY